MNNLAPPVQLACPENQQRIEYIINFSNQKDFEFTSVSIKRQEFRDPLKEIRI